MTTKDNVVFFPTSKTWNNWIVLYIHPSMSSENILNAFLVYFLWETHSIVWFHKHDIAQKVSIFGVILVCIFPAFRLSTGKCGKNEDQNKPRIQTLFTQRDILFYHTTLHLASHRFSWKFINLFPSYSISLVKMAGRIKKLKFCDSSDFGCSSSFELNKSNFSLVQTNQATLCIQLKRIQCKSSIPSIIPFSQIMQKNSLE